MTSSDPGNCTCGEAPGDGGWDHSRQPICVFRRRLPACFIHRAVRVLEAAKAAGLGVEARGHSGFLADLTCFRQVTDKTFGLGEIRVRCKDESAVCFPP